MIQLTEEQQERLKRIRHYSKLSYAVTENNQVAAGLLRDVRSDLNFLLSLLDSDSQAANVALSHCALCEDPHFLYRNCTLDAATRMRDECVAKVEQYADEFYPHEPQIYDGIYEAAGACRSLTLDQEQEKQQQ